MLSDWTFDKLKAILQISVYKSKNVVYTIFYIFEGIKESVVKLNFHLRCVIVHKISFSALSATIKRGYIFTITK